MAEAEDDYEATKRAEAEARRKRIMEKSKDRMNKVSGLQSQSEGDGEEKEAAKSSSAARMQAARRRRFKKGAKAKGDESSAEKTTTPEGEEAAKPATEEKVEGDKKPDEAPAEEATPEAPPKEEPKAAEEPEEPETTITESKPEEPAKKEEPSTPAPEETADAASSEPKKKYKGVAKMRREKMLQKKKEEAAKAAEEEAKVSESPAVVARQKKRLKQPLLPIVMYIFTSFLLFLAGLDVGLQHADPEYTLVNRDFAPQNFNVQKLIPWSSSSSSKGPIKDLGGSDTDTYTSGSTTEQEDEFGGVGGGIDDVEEDYIPNIDPLFRVDLDELTKGPGVFNQLARGAVRIHRMILYVCLEFPLHVLALPARLFGFPPVMCLTALTIRQLVAKVVLGAKLPDNAIEEDVRNQKGEITDVLTMIKNAVKNTLAGLFPTAISAYEVFQQLKVDMYVILFGVFVGLLYSTWATPPAAVLPPEMEEMEMSVEPDPVPVMEEEIPVEPDPVVMEAAADIPVDDVVDSIMTEADIPVDVDLDPTMMEQEIPVDVDPPILQDGINDEL